MTEHLRRSGSWRTVLNDLATVAVIVMCGTIVWTLITRKPSDRRPRSTESAQVPSAPLVLTDSASLGSANSPAVVIEFSDFQCAYCAAFARESLPTLKREYIDTATLQLVFRHLPIDRIHANARQAAAAAECAGLSGQFWEMHDRLFQDANDVGPASIKRHAQELGLDPAGFDSCLSSSVTDRIRRDVDAARALRISGTPTFLIGHRLPDGRIKVAKVLAGALPVDEFREALDQVLDRVAQALPVLPARSSPR